MRVYVLAVFLLGSMLSALSAAAQGMTAAQLEAQLKELDANLQATRQALAAARKAEAAAQVNAPLPPTDKQLLIPRFTKAPVIDGVIDPAEWEEAAAYPSGTGAYGAMRARVASTYYLGWTPEMLYVAQRMPLRDGELPVRLNRKPKHDGVDAWESVVEFYIDRKTTGSTNASQCRWQFMGNASGNRWDYEQQYSIGQKDYDWNAEWQYKQRVTPDGKFWETEMAFPRASVYQGTPLADGDRWWIGMAASLQFPWQWSGFYGWGIPATFREGVPSIRVAHPERGLLTKRLDIDVEVVNTTPRAQELTLVARIWNPEKKDIVVEKRVPVSLAPGKRFATTIDESAAQAVDRRSYQLTVMALQGDASLYTWSYGLSYGDPQNVEGLEVVIDKMPFGLKAGYYPLRNELKVTVDKFDVAQRDAVKRALITVAPAAGGPAVATTTITAFDYEEGIAYLPLPKSLPAGIYTVAAVLQDGAGAALAAHQVTFERKDLATAYPWLGNAIGKAFTVPRFFTPIAVTKDGLLGYRKKTTLTGSALPATITAAGIELLAAPIQLRGQAAGQPFTLVPSQKTARQAGKATPATVSYTGRAAGGPLTAEVQYRFDYDGVARVELTLAPVKGGAAFDNLQLVIPFRGEAATHFMVNGRSMRQSNRAGLLPGAGKTGTVWASTEMPAQRMTVGSFVPIVHLGNLSSGLTWFADSDQGWWPSTTKPAIEIVRTKDNTVELVCNLASDAVTLTAPRTIVFGLCAVPVRKVTPFKSSNGVVGFGYLEETGRWDPKITPSKVYARMYPDNPVKFREYADITHRYNRLTKPYVEQSSADLYDAEVAYFGPEWESMFAQSATDSRLYWTEKFIKDCQIDGYYMDNLFIREYRDPRASHAYLLPDGRVQPGYDLWAMREYARRLRNVFERYRDPVMICIHNTDFQFAPVMGYADLAMGGENPLPAMGTPDYMDMWPRDWMDVMYNEPLWGYKISHLNHQNSRTFVDDLGGYDQPAALKSHRTMMASMLVHGVEYFAGIDYKQYLMGKFKLFKRLPGETVFVPSWQANGLFKVANADKDIDVAVYRKPDALLIIVANYAKQKKRASIRMDFPKLLRFPQPLENRALYDFETMEAFNGLLEKDAPTAVRDAGHGADATLHIANTLQAEVEPRDFRIFLLINEPVAQGAGF